MKRFAAQLMLQPRTTNSKTGDVPTIAIGRSESDARSTCEGCPQLKGGCYAWATTVRWGYLSALRASEAGRTYGLVGLFDRHPNARMIRLGSIGDPGRADRGQLRTLYRMARREKLAIVGYTHHWRDDAADLRGKLMASCDSLAQIDEANAAGWRAAAVAPAGTTGTIRRDDGSILAVECPAIAAERMGKTFTCNDCASSRRGALCDASVDAPAVYFAAHGSQAKLATERAKALDARKTAEAIQRDREYLKREYLQVLQS